MKMRDELELYKTKNAELEDKIEFVINERVRILGEVDSQYQMQIGEMKEKFNKDLQQKDSTIKYRSDSADEANRQLNNLHDILDVIPGVLPRKKVEENGYAQNDNACHVRLASVLAQKFM